MKVIYYNPQHIFASFIGAYLHSGSPVDSLRLEKLEEITDQLDYTKPFIIFIGKGKNGEEIYLLSGTCSIMILRKSVESFLTAFGKNCGQLIWVNPLPETHLILPLVETLRITALKNRAYYYYLRDIEASVKRARLQVKHYKIGV